MKEKNTNLPSPQLVVNEGEITVALAHKQVVSLYKKSEQSGISFDTLKEVYQRGYASSFSEQTAFNRVNSFIAGGKAAEIDEDLLEDKKGYKNPTGGLTQKGRDHFNRETGSHLKAPVTTPPSKLKSGSKAAGRRKSFCARMGGMEGPMKKPNGEPTRKALALRKWNCEETQIDEKTCNCWDGYKPVPGTKPCAPGSCARPSAIDEKRGLWDNIHAKRNRIKHGSGEHMRKPGSKGAPTDQALKDSQNEGRVLPDLTQKPIEPQHSKEYAARMKDQKIKRAASEKERNHAKAFAMHMWAKRTRNESYTGAEKVSSNPNKPSNRFVGTDNLTNNYEKTTPGYTSTIKRVAKEAIKELAIRDVSGKMIPVKKELSRGANMKLHKTYPGKSSSSGGGGGD